MIITLSSVLFIMGYWWCRQCGAPMRIVVKKVRYGTGGISFVRNGGAGFGLLQNGDLRRLIVYFCFLHSPALSLSIKSFTQAEQGSLRVVWDFSHKTRQGQPHTVCETNRHINNTINPLIVRVSTGQLHVFTKPCCHTMPNLICLTHLCIQRQYFISEKGKGFHE